MELIKIKDNDINKLKLDFSKMVATIGEFDGVHLAHQKLIIETKAIASSKSLYSAVITFYPHPDYIIKSRNYDGYLTTLKEKIEIFENYHIDYLFIIDFSKELMQMPKEEFFNSYLANFSHLVVGYDFRFGYHGLGDALYLQEKLGSARLSIIDEVKCDNDNKISSNLIRSYLKEGQVEQANILLAYPYSFKGEVIKGAQIGTSLGFPTANVEIDEEKFIPKCGVYSAKVIINNKIFNGILNIGTNPSINLLEKPRLEVHIIDFDGDIYGANIEIKIYHFIREEIKFSKKEELISQIKKDQEYCEKEFLGEKHGN